MKRLNVIVALTLALALAVPVARADEPQPSHHKLYRDCMAKQKEADSGKNHDEMKAFCEDYAKTQHDADKEQKTPPAPKT